MNKNKKALKNAFVLGVDLCIDWPRGNKYNEDALEFYKSQDIQLTEAELRERQEIYSLVKDEKLIISDSNKSLELLYFIAGYLASSYSCYTDSGIGGAYFFTKERIDFYDVLFSKFGYEEKEEETHMLKAIDFFPLAVEREKIGEYFEYIFQNYKKES